MKYYHRQPIRAYIIIPAVFAALSSAIVLPICAGFSNGDLSSVTCIIAMLTQYLFFLSIYAYLNRFKDYVELSPGEINIVYDERQNKPSVYILTKDIILLEILTNTEPSSDEYYLVYPSWNKDAPVKDRSFFIGSYQVPLKDMVDFCAENNIVPVYKMLNRFHDLESVTLSNKQFILKYFGKKKAIKIPVGNIISIDFITPHAISTTDVYYLIRTSDGSEYDFGWGFVEQEKLLKYGKKHGFPVGKY